MLKREKRQCQRPSYCTQASQGESIDSRKTHAIQTRPKRLTAVELAQLPQRRMNCERQRIHRPIRLPIAVQIQRQMSLTLVVPLVPGDDV